MMPIAPRQHPHHLQPVPTARASKPSRAAQGIAPRGLTGTVGLSHCSALVANDSGALHVAAAMGIPVSAIYGPTDERYSLPLTSSTSSPESVHAIFHPVFCRPCGLRDCPIDHRCMKRISPDRVFESVKQQLRNHD